MESAWVAGAFGLIGSVIGALATIVALRMSNAHQRKVRAEELMRERDALLSAFAAELDLIAQLTSARSTVIRRNAEQDEALPTALLRTELIGSPFYFSKLGDRVSAIPPALVEEIATAYALCSAADTAILRWVEHEDVALPLSLRNLATLLDSASAKCKESASKLRAGRAKMA